jgi:glutamine amidotransferase
MTIAILDYGAGNLRSIQKGLERVSEDEVVITTKLEGCDAVVLPGVGSFGAAMEKIEPVRGELMDAVKDGKALLGVCLGMQLLFEGSEESPGITGLGLLEGGVKRFQRKMKVPQMGWNTLEIRQRNCPLLKGVPDRSYVYFVHSYYCVPGNAGVTASETEYGVRFCSTLWKDNLYGTQFHPEKSGKMGLKMLENFVELVR